MDGEKGKCLLCLSICNNDGGLLATRRKVAIQSAFKMLLRYLKIDLTKRDHFSSSTLSPSPVSSPDSNISVELCDRCSSLTSQFHKFFQAFERIRLELDRYAGKLHDAIEEGDKDVERVREYRKLVKPPAKCSIRPVDALNASIAQSLRREVMEKCAKRISSSTPRVFIIPDESSPSSKMRKYSSKSACSSDGIKIEEESEGPSLVIKNLRTITSIRNGEDGGTGEIIDGSSLLERDPLELGDSDTDTASECSSSKDPLEVDADCEMQLEESSTPRGDDHNYTSTVRTHTAHPGSSSISAETEETSVQSKIKYSADSRLKTGKVECKHCRKMLSNVHCLRIHIKAAHSGVRERYRCFHCAKVFTRQSALRIHSGTEHTLTIFKNRFPSGTTEDDFQKVVNKVMSQMRKVYITEDCGALSQKFGCQFCDKIFMSLNNKINRTAHILRCHLDHIISRVKKEKLGGRR